MLSHYLNRFTQSKNCVSGKEVYLILRSMLQTLDNTQTCTTENGGHNYLQG